MIEWLVAIILGCIVCVVISHKKKNLIIRNVCIVAIAVLLNVIVFKLVVPIAVTSNSEISTVNDSVAEVADKYDEVQISNDTIYGQLNLKDKKIENKYEYKSGSTQYTVGENLTIYEVKLFFISSPLSTSEDITLIQKYIYRYIADDAMLVSTNSETSFDYHSDKFGVTYRVSYQLNKKGKIEAMLISAS